MTRNLPDISKTTFWECPKCSLKDITYEPLPHSQFHSCRGLFGLTAPMVPVGTECNITINEREDYVGKEDVQVDGRGRPVMNLVIEREDGQDCVIYAPCVSTAATATNPGR